MPIRPWRATSIQMKSERATQAPDDASAKALIQRNIDRLVGLIEKACDSGQKPDLVVFPEFAMQGPPLKMHVREWIARWGAGLHDAASAGDAADALTVLDSLRVLCAHRQGRYGVSSWSRQVREGFPIDPGEWPLGQPTMVTRNRVVR